MELEPLKEPRQDSISCPVNCWQTNVILIFLSMRASERCELGLKAHGCQKKAPQEWSPKPRMCFRILTGVLLFRAGPNSAGFSLRAVYGTTGEQQSA